jgi:CDP-diacylglycerol--inositol 3-phosphatidyltransferase
MLQNVLFAVCALNELFFIALYLLSFSSPLLSPALLVNNTANPLSAQPGSPAVPRSLFPNPWSAAAMELARANKIDSTVPWIIAGVSAPVCLFKQVLNVIQLINASKSLAEVDIKARREARMTERKKVR